MKTSSDLIETVTPPYANASRDASNLSSQLATLLNVVYKKMQREQGDDVDDNFDNENLVGAAVYISSKLNTLVYELNISINPEDE